MYPLVYSRLNKIVKSLYLRSTLTVTNTVAFAYCKSKIDIFLKEKLIFFKVRVSTINRVCFPLKDMKNMFEK